uniref:Uncharacterized protein n=1 Tax=Chromera velia CCMP2878 TaxID=1169474 RepID=A0A0G4HS15_9ALVE|eukprot:Cvel_8184.t1-p1 / transcript=Cvel_8184.t1 / gene=Cvel_8184 / organism=Chromera_velia_CCMP2878 / gene_product=hypothetical protein / transcript_product=hypothetical protein / location=Cvel_scaffold446:17815-20839(+) / protein_length=325 / sequence_SO=supercontig / SO=protein_coding / is_pseudo=false
MESFCNARLQFRAVSEELEKGFGVTMNWKSEVDPGKHSHRIAKENCRKGLCIQCGQQPTAPCERRHGRHQDEDRTPSFLCTLCLHRGALQECAKCCKMFVPAAVSHSVDEAHAKWRCFECLTWSSASIPRTLKACKRYGTCHRCGCGCGTCERCRRYRKDQKKEEKLTQKRRENVKAVVKKIHCEEIERGQKRAPRPRQRLAAADRPRFCEVNKGTRNAERDEEIGSLFCEINSACASTVVQDIELEAEFGEAQQTANHTVEEVTRRRDAMRMLEAALGALDLGRGDEKGGAEVIMGSSNGRMGRHEDRNGEGTEGGVDVCMGTD